EWNGERGLESVEKSGIENFRRRRRDDNTIPSPIAYRLPNLLNDEVLLTRYFIKRISVEIQTQEIHFDFARNQGQKTVVMRHRAGAAANETYRCFGWFSHRAPPPFLALSVFHFFDLYLSMASFRSSYSSHLPKNGQAFLSVTSCFSALA